MVSRSTFGKSKWAGLTYTGWQGIRVGWWQPFLTLGFELSLPMKPELAPCGWRCPHRRPTVLGSIGKLLIVVYLDTATFQAKGLLMQDTKA
jgi:hypothetical protein